MNSAARRFYVGTITKPGNSYTEPALQQHQKRSHRAAFKAAFKAVPSDPTAAGQNGAALKHQRIFHHGLDAVLPEDNNPLHRATRVADGVEHILQGNRGEGSARGTALLPEPLNDAPVCKKTPRAT